MTPPPTHTTAPRRKGRGGGGGPLLQYDVSVEVEAEASDVMHLVCDLEKYQVCDAACRSVLQRVAECHGGG